METFSVREQIVEIVNKLFIYTDERQWDKLQSEVFTQEVQFDMSSLGGPKERKTAIEICKIWEDGLKEIDAVNHLAGNYLVNIQENSAQVFAYATATHYKESASHGKTREFVGTYELDLVFLEKRWRIGSFKYNLKYANGNMELS